MYMETCPRCAPIPPNMAIGGMTPRKIFGAAGSGKSLLTQFEDHSDLLEQGIVPVTSLLSGEFEFTEEDVLSAIEQFRAAKQKMPEPSYPPFTWDEPGFSLHLERDEPNGS